MSAPIADADTIADVLPLLQNPEEYVRGVLGRMWEHKAREPIVRIGKRGKGLYPCYRLVAGDGTDDVLGAFNDNHTPFPTAVASQVDWSTGAMGIGEVQQVLGQIRAAKKGGGR